MLILTCLARIATLILVCHTHARIVHSVEIRLKSGLVVNLSASDLSYRHFGDGVGRKHSKLKGTDTVLIHTERRLLLSCLVSWHFEVLLPFTFEFNNY